jgi:hypothetical protein
MERNLSQALYTKKIFLLFRFSDSRKAKLGNIFRISSITDCEIAQNEITF